MPSYEDIFGSKHLLLPKSTPSNKTFRQFLFELLDDYINLLNSIDEESIIIDGLKRSVITHSIIKIQENFVSGIKQTIDIYLDGQPAKAFEVFSSTIDYRRVKYKKILNIEKLSEEASFFRIREKGENYPFTASEMFHIPFEYRGKVSTQRYSIPGFPSLYLAKTLYVAWEELNRPALHNFQAVRLINKKPIKYLDLTSTDWGENHSNKKAYKYLMTWPLIAACSIKVKEHSNVFKPEYIIPQLLLQWVRKNKEIDGIKYSSTHIDTGQLKTDGGLYNLVLPVKENKDSGHCTHLTGIFEMTEIISWVLLEYATGGGTYLHSHEEDAELNARLPSIEIIKGRKYPYSSSALGNMERYLDYMPTHKIK